MCSPLPARGEPVPGRELDELAPILIVDGARSGVESIGLLGLQVGERLSILPAARVDRDELNIESSRDRLGFPENEPELIGPVIWYADPPRRGNYLGEQLQAFGNERALGRIGNAGDVAAGAREAPHVSSFNRSRAVRHDDRNRGRGALGREDGVSPGPHAKVDPPAHELARQGGQPLGLAAGVAALDHQGAPLDIPELAQLAFPPADGLTACRMQIPNSEGPRARLRHGLGRPRREAQNETAQEVATLDRLVQGQTACLVDAGEHENTPHALRGELGVAQQSGAVHQDELLGQVRDRARALHAADHPEV